MNYRLVYPNFSAKAISFTIDDGNLTYDIPFLDILRPHGILGTFNLSPSADTPPETLDTYRELYRGYGIANHCARHPFAFSDGVEYNLADESFDPDTADTTLVYREAGLDGFYLIHRPRGWRRITTPEHYIKAATESRAILEKVFGREIKDYVWPFGTQHSSEVLDHLYSEYRSVRCSSCTRGEDGFLPPESLFEWGISANHETILPVAERFENTPDDGRLRLFIFGVHSVDYARHDNYESLRTFAERYGDRPDDFWYASVEDIFDYLAAIREIESGDGHIENKSDMTVYLLVGDKRVVIPPHSRFYEE